MQFCDDVSEMKRFCFMSYTYIYKYIYIYSIYINYNVPRNISSTILFIIIQRTTIRFCEFLTARPTLSQFQSPWIDNHEEEKFV